MLSDRSGPAVLVFDVGKTHSKLSLWRAGGEWLAQRSYRNAAAMVEGHAVLDHQGIEAFLGESLALFAAQCPIGAIVPVAHGAAAAIVEKDRLLFSPVDYEAPIPPQILADYRAGRDPFAVTGSPAMPGGLNLGAQLHAAEARGQRLAAGALILPWPQYWAWRLCGVAASEVSSLGCHTDLWVPGAGTPSPMAQRRGWAARLAPLRHAGEILGGLSPEWQARTGIGPDCAIFCGLHDSNAALVAARRDPALADAGGTLLSTGTWFVAMQSAGGAAAAEKHLDPQRDCLLNVDIDGRPVPSARFMGGRELDLLLAGLPPADGPVPVDEAAIACLIAEDALPGPAHVPGVGPFPNRQGCWPNRPTDPALARMAALLYLALVSDVMLDLVGSDGAVLVDGPAAGESLFVRALASLRPGVHIAALPSRDAVALGALFLAAPQAVRPAPAPRAMPLAADLRGHAGRWRARIGHAP